MGWQVTARQAVRSTEDDLMRDERCRETGLTAWGFRHHVTIYIAMAASLNLIYIYEL